MSKKQQVVLLNIKNFGVNQNLMSKDNLFKLVPFSNFKNLLGVLNTSQAIEYENNFHNFKDELFEAFNLKSNNFLKLANSAEKLDEINNFLVNKDLSQIDPTVHLFVHLDNEFELNNSQILATFLEKLQTFLDNQEYAMRTKMKFSLNLIVSRALYNWDFLSKTIAKIQASFEIVVIINSITASKHLLKNDFKTSVAQNYFREIFAKQHQNTFYSLHNVLLKIQRADKIEDVWVNENTIFQKFKDNSLVLFISFKNKELEVLASAFLGFKNTTSSLLLEFDKYTIKDTIDGEARFLEAEALENIIISTSQRDNFLFGLFPESIIEEINVKEGENPYQYVLALAEAFYKNLLDCLKLRKTDIITLNWNIFREVKEKFGPHLWFFSIIVFDIYISRIINVLNQKRIRWMLFSTSYGFEWNFKPVINATMTTMYLTNKVLTPEETKAISMFEFHDVLASFLLDDNKTKNLPVFRLWNSINLQRQVRNISRVNSDQKLLAYLRKSRPQKYKTQEPLIMEVFEKERLKNKITIEKGVANLFVKKVAWTSDDLFLSFYYLERQLYNVKALTKISDLFYFYRQVKDFQVYLKQNPGDFLLSRAKPNALKKIFFVRYLNYLNKMIKMTENDENFSLVQEVKYFRQHFKKFENEYKTIKAIKLMHLKDSVENHKIFLAELKRKGIKHKDHAQEWRQLYSKIQDKENQNFKTQFDLTKLVAIDNLVDNQITTEVFVPSIKLASTPNEVKIKSKRKIKEQK